MARNVLVAEGWRPDIEPYTDENGAFGRAGTTFRARFLATNRPRDRPDRRDGGPDQRTAALAAR